MGESWVGDWTKTATYWFQALLAIASLLSRSAWLLDRGSWGPIALCWVLVLSTASYSNCNNWLQTNWTSCRTGLYHCLTSTCFLWASHLHPIQPVHGQGYTLISSTGCICSLIVVGQYVTYIYIYIYIYIHLNAFRQMTDVKLFVLHSNTRNN